MPRRNKERPSADEATRQPGEPAGLTEEELAQADGEPLADRQAMSVIRQPFPQPVFPDPSFTIDPPPTDDV